MATKVVYNGQKLDLSANPDLLFQMMLTLTNLEERMDSFDKRLRNIQDKIDVLDSDNFVIYDTKKSEFYVKKH